MRHLYPGHDHDRTRAPRCRHARRREDPARRQSLPLHGVSRDLSRRAQVEGAAVRMKLNVAELDVRTPRTLEHALELLREEPRTPLAGTTDLYVELNFGTLKPRRFLDLWGLDELRGIVLADDPQ